MKNKKLLFLAATLLLGAGSLASCTGGDDAFLVWAAKEDKEFITKVISNFKAANPEYADVKIKFTALGEPEVAAQLKTDLKGSADVFHFPGDGLGELVKSNYLYNIPKSLIEGNGVSDEVLAAGRVDDGQYGIPFTPNTYFLYYDANVYSAEDVLSLDAMLAKDLTDTGYQYNISFDIGNGWYQQSLFFSNGCTVFGEEGNDPTKGFEPVEKAVETTKFMYDLLQKTNIKFADSATVGGDCAAGITGTWYAEATKERITTKGGTYAAAPLPKLTIGENEVAWKSVGDFKHVGVNSTTDNPELASKLAAYITNVESQKLRFELRTTAPTNEELASDTTVEWDASIVAQTAQLENTFAQPTIYDAQGYWNAAGAFNDDIKELGASADLATITEVFEQFNATITKAE